MSQRIPFSRHVIVLSMATAVCMPPAFANQQGQAGVGGQLTPAEVQMQKDLDRANKTVFEGAVVGAAVGALAGAFLGKMVGGNSKDTRNAALAGAAAGAALGGLDGYRTANLEKAGNDEVRALQQQIADIESDASRLRQALKSTESVIGERHAVLATLRDEVTAGRVSVAQARDQVKRDEQHLAQLNKTLEAQKKKYEDHVKLATSFRADETTRRDAEQKLAQLRTEIEQMQNVVANYQVAVLTVSRA